jgi:DNA-binding LytR/AlgR family response regulator
VRARTIVLDTFIIAIFPITVINLANYARLLHRNARVVQEANLRLEHPAALPHAEEREIPTHVVLVAENDKDTFRVALDDLLFIQAEENYVQVHYRGDKPGRVLLRSGLTRVAGQLRPFYPRLFRCHRAFIVHTDRIASVDGNAQGLKLALRDTTFVVPVARRYVDEFRRVIRGL